MRRVRVVDPDLAAVGDDQLLVGLDILPAEQARRGQRDAAAGCFLELAVDVVDGLRELPVQTLEAVGEGIQLLARTGEGGGRQQQGQHDAVAACAHGGVPDLTVAECAVVWLKRLENRAPFLDLKRADVGKRVSGRVYLGGRST